MEGVSGVSPSQLRGGGAARGASPSKINLLKSSLLFLQSEAFRVCFHDILEVLFPG